MQDFRRFVSFGAVVLVSSALALGSVVPANAEAERPSILSTLESANTQTVQNIAPIEAADRGGAAFAAQLAGVDVLVPSDAEAALSIGEPGSEVLISLPFADTASAAEVLAPGVMAYENANDSTTVPVVKNDGSVQINTVIDSVDAPTRYDYEIGISDGSSFVSESDGSITVLDAALEVTAVVAPPWATDANGQAVATHYEVIGNTITQIVQHNVAGVAYPVVADPWWIPALRLVGSWTNHALQKIAQQNIAQNLVKIAVQEGKKTAGNTPGTSVFTANSIRVVVNNKTGAIITVYRAGGGGGGGGV
ncbi:DUF4258 domain-containing protein [Cryobacterium sp. PH31-O1]|uniref:DUF4258 domain-containing protein n=1 Tax=Cryobacterium sp. PH31-O1 TaxID=3046306 RepID=UPI0024BA5D24|nr:DUF4258 domain-containing protein [Cryobacterium sp. PH31-O1]MDJ0336744.1 DUF4258 domain-containing protein [Cryobacterium sp. PH31-O1]